jgi:hypothetical protein
VSDVATIKAAWNVRAGRTDFVVRRGTVELYRGGNRAACEGWLEERGAARWRYRDELTGGEMIQEDQWLLDPTPEQRGGVSSSDETRKAATSRSRRVTATRKPFLPPAEACVR